MNLSRPHVPAGVHPWDPSDREFEAKLAPLIDAETRLARECTLLAGDLLAETRDDGSQVLFDVLSTLLVRTLQDLRAVEYCVRVGYTMQGRAVASSAYEAAHLMGYLASDQKKARDWITYEREDKPFVGVFDSVRRTHRFLGIAQQSDNLEASARESYEMYEHLCLAKHVHPIIEVRRYQYRVADVANLVITPVFVDRHVREIRGTLLLAIRSVLVALMVYDRVHVTRDDREDLRLVDIMLRHGDELTRWRLDTERAIAELRPTMEADRSREEQASP